MGKMAPLVSTIYLMFLTISTIYHNGLADSQVHIEILPNEVNEMLPVEVRVSCLPDDNINSMGEIMIFELGREDEMPMVILRQNSNLTLNLGTKKNIKAYGHFNKIVSDSYIKLAITNPRVSDSGIYLCVMHYIDKEGKLMELRSQATLTVHKQDITSSFDLLVEQLSSLKEKVEKQEDTINDQKIAILDLKNELQDQKISILTNQANVIEKVDMKDRELTTDYNHLKEEVSSLKAKVKRQENVIREQKSEMLGMENRLQDWSTILKSQASQVNTMVKKASFTSAFSAGHIVKDSLISGATIIFRDVFMKEGPGYDEKTGKFTAPTAGLYVFHLVLTSEYKDMYAGVDLRANNRLLAKLFNRNQNNEDQSSISTVVKLNKGDVVHATVAYMTKNFKLWKTSYYSVFTGYLIKPL